MLALLNKTSVIALLFISLISFYSVRVALLKNDIEMQTLQLETKSAELETAKQSIASVSQVNSNLNATIDTLTQHLDDERRAVDFIKQYNDSVDESVKSAVGELKGLLQNEEDDCGSRPLPPDVVDRMWQHYRAKGRNPDT